MKNYFDIAFTPSIRQLQEQKGSAHIYAPTTPMETGPDALDERALQHITARDSFYMATVSEAGWPYLQHRGGDRGFVKIVGPSTIGWIEHRGNRQYIGTGNIVADQRVSLILVDYPNRTRLKIFGHARYHDQPSDDLLESLDATGSRNDGAITLEVLATDWNCPKYLTPRYTLDEIGQATTPLLQRIAELESQLSAVS